MRAFLIICTPIFWSKFAVSNLSSSFEAYRSATPPPAKKKKKSLIYLPLVPFQMHSEKTSLPGTIPSSTAALVAFRASVTLSFFSLTSASLAPPIYKKPISLVQSFKRLCLNILHMAISKSLQSVPEVKIPFSTTGRKEQKLQYNFV